MEEPAGAMTAHQIYFELEEAVQQLSSRCLHSAARWCAEQMAGLFDGGMPPPLPQHSGDMHDAEGGFATPGPGGSGGNGDAARRAAALPPCSYRPAPEERHPMFMLARTHFEFKEYQRAAHALAGVQGSKAFFVRLYALYLAGEKRKEEQRVEQGGPLGRSDPSIQNPHLDEIETQLEQALLPRSQHGQHAQQQSPGAATRGMLASTASPTKPGTGGGTGGATEAPGPQSEDGFLWYLYGMVLSDKGRVEPARQALVRAVHLAPCNWGAWQALQAVCPDVDSLAGLALPLPSHWARGFFLATAALELQQNQEALSKLHALAQLFRGSLVLEGLVAQAHYNLQNFGEAQVLYEDVAAKDPYRLEGMDTYSNILFVQEAAAALSLLAHRALATDKYRPEACCVAGNYYSLKGQHERAVEFFRRALKLNRHYLAAWTLMGHEYMELKNTQAAITAYRHSIDINRHDFRAWYGLGQAYELLKMPLYALYYYRRAAALRPTDPRMWIALAQCYCHEQVEMHDHAIKCYRRAIRHNDPDGIAVPMLAKLYEQRGERGQAEVLFRYSLARLEAEGGPGAAVASQDGVEALLFLAAYCKDTGRLEEAEAFCAQLMDVGGPAKERAKSLAREIRSLQQHHAVAAPGGITGADGGWPGAGAGQFQYGGGGGGGAGGEPAQLLLLGSGGGGSGRGRGSPAAGDMEAVGEDDIIIDGGDDDDDDDGGNDGGEAGVVDEDGSGGSSDGGGGEDDGDGGGGTDGMDDVAGEGGAGGLFGEDGEGGSGGRGGQGGGGGDVAMAFDGVDIQEMAVSAVIQQLNVSRPIALELLSQADQDPATAMRIYWAAVHHGDLPFQ